MKSNLPKSHYPKAAIFSLLIAWVTLTINVNAILVQHAHSDWGIATFLGTLLTAIFMLVFSNLELTQRVFTRRMDYVWVFILMPLSAFFLCHGAIQFFWIMAPFLHVS